MSEPLQQQIKDLAKQYADEFIKVRHYLHTHPELSYKEFETSALYTTKINCIKYPF